MGDFLIMFIAYTVILYVAGSIISADFHPFRWTKMMKVVGVSMWVVGAMMLGSFALQLKYPGMVS